MAETVLLLHSGGLSSRQWRKLSDTLSDKYRVVAPDLLGYGQNPPWPDDAPFDMEQDLASLEPYIEQPLHVVGHSYGGLLALKLASHYPVRSLALYDPVAFGILYATRDVEGLADLETLDRDPVFHDDVLGGREPWLSRFVDYWNGPGSWDALPQPSRQNFLQVGRKVYLEVCSIMTDRSDFGGIDAPSLLVHGETSPVAARCVVQRLAETLPHSTVHSLPGAGHMGPITHADALNDLIAAHLMQDGVRAGRPPM